MTRAPAPVAFGSGRREWRQPERLVDRADERSDPYCAWSGRTRWSGPRPRLSMLSSRPDRPTKLSKRDAQLRWHPLRLRVRVVQDPFDTASPGHRCPRPGWPKRGASDGSWGSCRVADARRGETPCPPSGPPRRSPLSQWHLDGCCPARSGRPNDPGTPPRCRRRGRGT